MRVEVLSSINSGKHNKGDIVDFPEPEAKLLIDSGAAKATKEKVNTKEPSKTKPTQNTTAPKKPKKKKAAKKGAKSNGGK